MIINNYEAYLRNPVDLSKFKIIKDPSSEKPLAGTIFKKKQRIAIIKGTEVKIAAEKKDKDKKYALVKWSGGSGWTVPHFMDKLGHHQNASRSPRDEGSGYLLHPIIGAEISNTRFDSACRLRG